MIETLKKNLLPGMLAFDLRSTLEEVSNYSKTDVSMKITSITYGRFSKKERQAEKDYTGGTFETSRVMRTFQSCRSHATIRVALLLRVTRNSAYFVGYVTV